jgi:hypothetical protein
MAGVVVPVVAPNTYANVDDLTLFWKAPDSTNRAEYLLKLASNRLRLIGQDVGLDVDAKVNSDPAYFMTVQWVVMESVKRALQSPVDGQPVETYGQTAGPYSENFKYSNPSGDLWFKKSELSAVGLYGTQTLGGLSTSQNLYGNIYSS